MATKAQDILDAIADGHYDHILNRDHSDDTYTFRGSEPPSAITLRAGAEDMIRCSPEGFGCVV